MKKYLLIAALFVTVVAKSQGPIVNSSFNDWAIDTYHLAAGAIGGIPADTIVYLDPVDWTSSNAISGLDSLGGQILVTPDSLPYWDTLAITMKTKLITLSPSLVATVGQGFVSTITLPGFVLNGKFPIGVGTLAAGGLTTITPAKVSGAGQPFTQRLASIGGYVNYSPSYSDSTNTYDNCMIYATLRKGSEIIANAIYESGDSTHGWKPFSANFVYVSCDTPDTLVILMSSSIPNIIALANQGASGLQPGSVFSVDSLYYDTVATGFVPVMPVSDYDTVLENSVNDTFNVTSNDVSCGNMPLSVSITSAPLWGTATAVDSVIIYNPYNGYSGGDTLTYTASNTVGGSGTATVYIDVKAPAAIKDVNQLVLTIYPVPTSSGLNVNFQNPGKTYARIYDMVGKLVGTTTFTSNNNTLNVANFADGIYSIELLNTDNLVVARSKFTVTK